MKSGEYPESDQWLSRTVNKISWNWKIPIPGNVSNYVNTSDSIHNLAVEALPHTMK